MFGIDAHVWVEVVQGLITLLVGLYAFRNHRQLSQLQREKRATEIAEADIAADERKDAMIDKLIKFVGDKDAATGEFVRDMVASVNGLTKQLAAQQELERERIALDDKRAAMQAQALQDLRSDTSKNTLDLLATQKILSEHVSVSTPAIQSIIKQVPTVDDTHTRVSGMPVAVRAEMQEDFQALRHLFEGLKLQVAGAEQQLLGVHQKLDIISQALQALANRAPDTPQPDTVPEMTKQVTVVGADPDDTLRTGGLFDTTPKESRP